MNQTRIQEMDLLRLLAALAVVLFHYTFRGYAANHMSVMPYPLLAPIFKYGYLGVPLFFMISGFVILMAVHNKSTKYFVASRAARLYPSLWVCCSLTYVVTLMIGAPHFKVSLKQYLINMTMLSGFMRVPSIDTSYWSLFIEIQFYVLVAITAASRSVNKAQSLIILWLIASIILQIFPISSLNIILIVDYSAFFISGATFFLIWSEGLSPVKILIIAASLSLAIFQQIHKLPDFEGFFNTTMSRFIVGSIVMSFFVIMFFISTKNTELFKHKFWLRIGGLTYPLYLLHAHIGFMIFNKAYPGFSPHIILWGTLILVLCAAYGIHVYIETPLSPRLKSLIMTFLEKINSSITFLTKYYQRAR